MHNETVAIVTGNRSRDCDGPALVKTRGNRFTLSCQCAEECTLATVLDKYFIVQPIDCSARLADVCVVSASGTKQIEIQSLISPMPSHSRDILGISQEFSLEAAFKDALRKANPKSAPAAGLFEVVAMGALYGGFSGFSRLFVRVKPPEEST